MVGSEGSRPVKKNAVVWEICRGFIIEDERVDSVPELLWQMMKLGCLSFFQSSAMLLPNFFVVKVISPPAELLLDVVSWHWMLLVELLQPPEKCSFEMERHAWMLKWEVQARKPREFFTADNYGHARIDDRKGRGTRCILHDFKCL